MNVVTPLPPRRTSASHPRAARWTRLAGRILPLLLLCLVAAGCTTTSKVSTRYYDVSGSTPRELEREIRRKGPNDGKAIAMAGIGIRPINLDLSSSNGACRFRRVRFAVDAAITLPRWREAATSRDAALRRNWKGFAAYAKAHEETHVEIAEAFARALERSLLAIPPQPSCTQLEAIAAEFVRRAVPLHRAAQLRFDADEQRRFARIAAEGERRERAQRAAR